MSIGKDRPASSELGTPLDPFSSRDPACGSRLVPLTPEIVEALRTQLSTDLGWNPYGLLWHRADGTPLTNGEMNQLPGGPASRWD